MPLLDHFHPPVFPTRGWGSFHNRWIVAIADALNARLPANRFLAETEMAIGTEFRSDVAELEESAHVLGNGRDGDGGVAIATYAPPRAARSVSVTYPESATVQVYDCREGKTLVGVVELMSPANKDRPDTRRAFATKCAALLHNRIGVVIVDIVTSAHFNLHEEILGILGDDAAGDLPEDNFLYAVAYRPVLRKKKSLLDLWPHALELSGALPTLPLALRGSFVVPIDLEATYTEARQRNHL